MSKNIHKKYENFQGNSCVYLDINFLIINNNKNCILQTSFPGRLTFTSGER